MGKLVYDLGKMSIYNAHGESSLRLSCIMKVDKNECLGEMSLCLRPFSYIFLPTGELKAISRVIIYSLGTYKIVSPFLISLAACTPL